MSNICWLFIKKNKKTDSPVMMNQSFLYILSLWAIAKNPLSIASMDSSLRYASFRMTILNYFSFLIAACAAANLATGTL